jgi:hypothetical protein
MSTKFTSRPPIRSATFILLRTLGLTVLSNIVTMITWVISLALCWRKIRCRSLIRIKLDEEPKVALVQNRWTALLRCAIHLPSVTITVALAWFNIKGEFVGTELPGKLGNDDSKLFGLQIAAKAHELFINASIAAMVHSYIVHELLLGKGIPFGALVAGQRFTEISYLWDADFWGAVLSKQMHCTWMRKSCLVLLIVICVCLAVVAAPSSAFLMIPRQRDVISGGTSFYINATADTLWPSELNSSRIPDNCLDLNAYTNYLCPSAGYQEQLLNAACLIDRSRSKTLPFGLAMYNSQRLRYMSTTERFGWYAQSSTTATTPMAAISEALAYADLAATALRWALLTRGVRYWYGGFSSPNTEALQPWTTAFCSNITQSTNNTLTTLSFWESDTSEEASWNLSNSTVWNQVLAASASQVTSSRLVWVERSFNNLTDGKSVPNTTIGAVVLLPVETTSLGFTYLTCNVDARWLNATIINCFNEIYCGNLNTSAYLDPPIKVSSDWAASLNPNITTNFNSSASAFANLAAQAGVSSSNDSTHRLVVESLLANLFTDGLARTASAATLQGTLVGAGSPSGAGYPHDGPWVDEWLRSGNAWVVNDPESVNWPPLRIVTHSTGHAYSLAGTSTRLALAVLLLHAALAVAHIGYLLGTGRFSASWDRIVELIALAMNSKRTVCLNNTCAGIDRMATLGLKVRAVPSGTKHLELRFGDANNMEQGTDSDELFDGQENGSTVGKMQSNVAFQVNEAYGSLKFRGG